MAKQDDKVTFRFTKSGLYRVVPATGIWGIHLSQDEILCNFVLDSMVLPSEIDYQLSSNGKLTEVKRKFANGKHDVEKELQVGVVMTKQNAAAIGEWLVKFSQETEEVEDGAGENAQYINADEF
jgi:hypothetical protein